jgi:hypothetical protein
MNYAFLTIPNYVPNVGVPQSIAKIGVEYIPIYTIKKVLPHLDPYKPFSAKS